MHVGGPKGGDGANHAVRTTAEVTLTQCAAGARRAESGGNANSLSIRLLFPYPSFTGSHAVSHDSWPGQIVDSPWDCDTSHI